MHLASRFRSILTDLLYVGTIAEATPSSASPAYQSRRDLPAPFPRRMGALTRLLSEDNEIFEVDGSATLYTFSAKYLPAYVRECITHGRLDLVPPMFRARLQQLATEKQEHTQTPSPSLDRETSQSAAQPAAPKSPQLSYSLVLNKWDYFIFSFCLWPLSDEGSRCIEDWKKNSKAVGLPMLGSVNLSSPLDIKAERVPLYCDLLASIFSYLLPISEFSISQSAIVFIESIAQFWLGQNPPASPHFAPTWIRSFQPTSSAVLRCLDTTISHLNAHERTRIANGFGRTISSQGSAHFLFLRQFLDFLTSQSNQLPDISARVAALIRVITHYLRPWSEQSTAFSNIPLSSKSLYSAHSDTEIDCESWEWAGFVCRNFLLYARLLTCVTREVCASRFIFNEKRDVRMLMDWMNLFEEPALLPTMRKVGEAAEILLNKSDGGLSSAATAHGDALHPLCEALRRQLITLEGVSNWRASCEALTPGRLYSSLDEFERHLQWKGDEIRRRLQGGLATVQHAAQRFAHSTPDALEIIDILRQCSQKWMQIIQPTSMPLNVRHPKTSSETHDLVAVGASARRLDPDVRSMLQRGRARCSAVLVPFRPTPQHIMRPVSQNEMRWLVNLAEKFAACAPPHLLRRGFHPRLLASRHSLTIAAFFGPLIATRAVGLSSPVFLVLFWWPITILLLATLTAVILNCNGDPLPHAPPATSTWVSWVVAKRLQNEDPDLIRMELTQLLEKTCTANEDVIDRILSTADEKLACHSGGLNPPEAHFQPSFS